MQKALVVRSAVDEHVGRSWSFEVDELGDSAGGSLRELLASGWRVVHTCPMPSELDCCCLVILEKPTQKQLGVLGDDVPIHELDHPAPWPRLPSKVRHVETWNGETIPLDAFDLAHK